MSGSWKLLEKLQKTFGGGGSDPPTKFEEVTFDNNETKRFTRSKSGRCKQFKRTRMALSDNTFDPMKDEERRATKAKEVSAPTVKEEKVPSRPVSSGSNVSALKERFEVKI